MDENKMPLDDNDEIKEEAKEPENKEPEKTEEPEVKEQEEKKEEQKPELPEEPKKQIVRKCGFWKAFAIILFILLLASIFTHGFRFGGITGKATAGTGVSVTVLSDSRCDKCDTTGLIAQLRALSPDLKVTELDYNDENGKNLYDELGIKYLPAVLFDKSVEDTAQYEKLQMYLVPAGDYLSLRIGADFNPEAEICDNGIDDTGNDLVDCEDPDCENSLVCRKEIKKSLQVFVMSHCPFGTKALDSMEEVLDAFKEDNIRFDVHYIAAENPDGTFNSLHGQQEVEENIRQLCAKKYYESDYKYMKYIWCRNKEINSGDWEDCAKDNGMSVTKIKACSEGDEGKELLREDILVAQGLGIGASPTWLANNKYQFGGIDAETIKSNFCKYNSKLKGCSATLSSDESAEGSC